MAFKKIGAAGILTQKFKLVHNFARRHARGAGPPR
jgi:hypothetical protein